MLQQIFVALIGFFRRSEAGELAHREEFAAISAGVNAPRVRRLSRIAKVLFVIPVFGEVGLGVQATDGYVGDGAETCVTVFVEIGAGRRADRLLRRLLDQRS